MIAAIMQPYFFPYIGYFQLMHAVDIFVFFDDVQYIDRGWVNRNRIRCNDTAKWLTFPVHKARRELAINQREYMLSDGAATHRIEQRLQASYASAPCRSEVGPVISSLLRFNDSNVAMFNANLLETLAQQLGITCRFLVSSQIDKPANLKGQAKVIDLCRRIGASHYVNQVGGVELYDAASFDAAGLRLSFLRTTAKPAMLADGQQYLSIIDGLMHEGFAGCGSRLAEHVLQAAE